MRLKEVVPKLPKPMAQVNGRPFLEFLMNYWIGQGVTRFILSVGYQNKIIINHFGNEFNGVSIEYSIEDSPLGTGGGFIKAAQKLNDPFLLLNGDTFIEMDLKRIIDFHSERKADWTLSVVRLKDSTRYMGIELMDTGQIISLTSSVNESLKMVNGGAYFINPSVVEKITFKRNIKLSLESDILPSLLSKNNSLFGIECTGDFIDIGIPEDYFRAQEICR